MTNNTTLEFFQKGKDTTIEESKKKKMKTLEFTKEEKKLNDIKNIIAQMKPNLVISDRGTEAIRKKKQCTLSECLWADPRKCDPLQTIQVIIIIL